MTRQLWVWLHRWVGLAVTIFLIVTALTGSVLVFWPEINEMIGARPSKNIPVQNRPMLDVFELRERALTLEPRADIQFLSLKQEAGKVFEVNVFGRTDPSTGKPYELGYAVLQLNPYTGELVRRTERDRLTGEPLWPVTRHNLMDVMFMLHIKLAAGLVGHWILGIVAMLWTLDCFVGFYLTLPRRRVAKSEASHRRSWMMRWLPAWTFALRGHPYRITFKLHTAAGLWTWVMLFIFAWSSVYFLMSRQVYDPVMKVFGMQPMLETFYAMPELPAPKPQPALSWREAAAIGERLAMERAPLEGFVPGNPINLQYEENAGLFIYTLASSRSQIEDGLGTIICFDGDTGALWKVFHLTGQDAGTTFTSWIALLHTAKVWGLPFRIFVCAMGLVVTMLSGTGIYIWWKKRKARRSSEEKHVRLVEEEAGA